jgi:hypothetical protein
MNKLLVDKEIIKLINKVEKRFTKQMIFFEKKLGVIEFQPLQEGSGPSYEFVKKFALALEEVLVDKSFLDKIVILVTSEKGPEIDEFDLKENMIYKIRIDIL